MASPLAWYRRHVWAASTALVCAVLAAAFLALQVAVAGRVPAGVRVAGVDVGSLDEGAAAAVLARRLAPAVATVTLRPGKGEPLVLTLAQMGVRVDVAASARRAAACGRHRLVGGLSVWLPGGRREVEPVVRVDAARYREALGAVRAAVDVPPRDARLTLVGDLVSVLPAREGREVDAGALLTRVLAAVRAGRAYAGPVPVRPVPPGLSTAAAEERARAAAACFAQPLVLRYRDTAVTLTRDDLVAIADITGGAAGVPLSFHNERARRLLHRLFAFAEQPPRDATVAVSREGQVTVVPSRSGRVLDMERLLDDMEAAVAGGGLRTVHVALVPAYPRLSTADVEAMGLAALGSQFTTAFDPGNEARARNIALAAGIVDGTVVEPGETFSLNAALGPRTVNRGFDYAPVIAADHVLRQGVGAASASTRRRCSTPSSSPACRWSSGIPTRSTSTTTRWGATPRWPGAASTSASATTPRGRS